MAEGRPTLHHLNNSQSMRVLWLLEELGIEYDLKLYERYTSGKKQARAPDELKQVHPLGKSPLLVTADGRTISETEAICNYLLKTYDTTKQFSGDPSAGRDDVYNDIISSYANSSLNLLMTLESMFLVIVQQSPFFLRPLFRALHNQVHARFMGPDMEAGCKYLEGELGEQDYFMGPHPGRADFMLQWPLDYMTQWKMVDLKKYPKLDQYYTRCQAREAWQRARSKGNGYKLVFGDS